MLFDLRKRFGLAGHIFSFLSPAHKPMTEQDVK